MRLLASATLSFLFALSTQGAPLTPRDFARAQNTFDVVRYFTGHTRSWGVIENHHGEPLHHFATDAIGRLDSSGDLLLTQNFTYDSGRTQQRRWHIHRVDAHHVTATANDIVGTARGEGWGNATRLEYDLALHPGNALENVHFQQWMYLPPGTDTMYTRVTVTKLGLTVAEVAESFHHVR